MLRLTRAASRVVVRLTGGSGFMAAYDGLRAEDIFPDALDGFDGALLFGGTRMIRRDSGEPVPSIMEAAVAVRAGNAGCVALGVTPRTGCASVHPGLGLVVHDDPADPYVTVVHPGQDACLLVQRNADDASDWDAEWRACSSLVRQLREFAGWNSLHVVWNGGKVTERETRAVAAAGWPVLLVEGSGRIADILSADAEFRAAHPNVRSAPATVPDIRAELALMGVLNDSRTHAKEMVP